MHPAMFTYLFSLTHGATEQRPLCYLTATNLVAFGPQIKILTDTSLKQCWKKTSLLLGQHVCASQREKADSNACRPHWPLC